jgi:hypothetical protein
MAILLLGDLCRSSIGSVGLRDLVGDHRPGFPLRDTFAS